MIRTSAHQACFFAHELNLFSQDLTSWGTRNYLDISDKLPVDTSLFPESDYPGFVAALLSSEEVLGGKPTLDDATTGVLIHSENFQALRLLQERYRKHIKCVYIDPPYNTDAGPIMYKNDFRSSAWMSLIADRIGASQTLTRDDGVTCVTIDDYQVHELAYILDETFGRSRELGVALIRNNPSGRSTVRGFSVAHEYALFYASSDKVTIARLPRSKRQLARFTTENGVLVDWRNFRKDGGDVTHRSERPKQFFPLYVDSKTLTIRIPPMTWNKSTKTWAVDEKPQKTEVEILPIDERGRDRVWSLNSKSARDQLINLEARKLSDGAIQVYRRHFPSAGVLPRTWWNKKVYAAREHGTSKIKALFKGRAKFSFAKAPAAVADCLRVSGMSTSECVLDYFAGSGTTGHAIINLNREDEGEGGRRFILVEMGSYFHAVLKPRIVKILYSPDWKSGRAVTLDKGVSSLVKCFALESYDDALNNLPSPTGGLYAAADPATKDALLAYSLDLELGPSLLNLAAFFDPWGYAINAQPAGESEIRPHHVDLVETFNYLLGLKVSAYGPIERYKADFERAEHEYELGRLKLTGRLRRDQKGEFIFQRVEGDLLDGTRVLVIWRKLTCAKAAKQDSASILPSPQTSLNLIGRSAASRSARPPHCDGRRYAGMLHVLVIRSRRNSEER